jgi:hypothetical protein
MGFVGDGLSGTERTEAAWTDKVPSGRRALLGDWGFVSGATGKIGLGSVRVMGGTERATEGGRLGGCLEPALETGGGLVGDKGVALSMRWNLLVRL